MKIGILQTGHVAEPLLDKHGDFADMFKSFLRGHDFEFTTYNVVDNEFPDTIDEMDAWLITGSAHGVYEDHAWIRKLEDFSRQAHRANIIIVGICFGHQMLAKALGGKVEKFSQGWAIGNQTYIMPDAEKAQNVIAWHQDQVTELADGGVEVGTSEFCKNAFVIYADNVFTMQAHPEFTTEFGRDLMRLREAQLPTELVIEAVASFDKKLDTENMAQRIASFLKRARHKT